MSQNTIDQKPAEAVPAERTDYLTPTVSILQNADGYTLEVELPGVPKTGVEVTFEEGKLTLIGRKARAEQEAAVYRESARADYRRVFDLDPAIDAARIEATVDQGLLTVRLPKSEAAKSRQIAVG